MNMNNHLREQWSDSGSNFPKDWHFYSIEELLETPKSISVGVMYPGPDTPGGIPLVRVGDVSDGFVTGLPEYCISDQVDYEYRRTKLVGNELLITLVGDPGECVIATDKMKGWNVARALAVLRLKDPTIRHWLRYVLHSRTAKYLIGARLNTTVQKTLNLRDIRELAIPFPPVHIRRAIEEVIGGIDEKIELNRKQNRTLEAIAQALFKRWFVEFEFPDQTGQPYKSSGGAMQPSELGEIPVGWEVGTIGDHVEHKKDSINPGDQPETIFQHFSIPNFDDGQDAKPELGSTILSNKYLVHAGTILVSKLNPRFPRIWPVLDLADGISVCSTEFQVLAPCEKAYGYVLSLLKSPYVASEMVLRASGTSGSHQRINPDDLLSIEVISPPRDLIERFSGMVLNSIKKEQINLNEMKVLAGLRDTLLPKLMSGELRVGDGAKHVGAMA